MKYSPLPFIGILLTGILLSCSTQTNIAEYSCSELSTRLWYSVSYRIPQCWEAVEQDTRVVLVNAEKTSSVTLQIEAPDSLTLDSQEDDLTWSNYTFHHFVFVQGSLHYYVPVDDSFPYSIETDQPGIPGVIKILDTLYVQ